VTRKQAKTIITELIDAEHCSLLAGMQDGGKKVDIIWSRRRLRTNEVMSLSEGEELMDAAIRSAYRAMTGFELEPDIDPVEFINS